MQQNGTVATGTITKMLVLASFSISAKSEAGVLGLFKSSVVIWIDTSIHWGLNEIPVRNM